MVQLFHGVSLMGYSVTGLAVSQRQEIKDLLLINICRFYGMGVIVSVHLLSSSQAVVAFLLITL